MLIVLVAALALVVLRVVVTGAPPQGPTATTGAQARIPKPDPPGTIDGAKNPELIPDEVAYRMIVLAVAEPPGASAEAKERARAKLNPIGLSEDDAAAFLGLLAEFRNQVDALDRQAADILVRAPIPHPASVEYRQLVDVGKQKNQLITDTVAAFPARLSQDGLRKLSAYLPQAKKGMKIIPDMVMPK
jgi:hypothetical protein